MRLLPGLALAVLLAPLAAPMTAAGPQAAAGATDGPGAGPDPGPAAAWDILPRMPQSRTEVAAVGVGGKVWVLGGFSDDPAGVLAGSTRVDVYDPATFRWTTGPNLPTPLHHTAVVALGPRIVVLGGLTTLGFAPTAATWVLDTSQPAPLQAWLPWVPLPGPRGAHAAATDGDRIWVFGGGLGLTGLTNLAFVWEPGGDPLGLGAWRRIADFPLPRDHLAGAFLDGKVYAVGGRQLSLGSNTGRLDAYDPATDTWTRGPDMPTPRGGIAAGAAAGRMVVFGGEAPGGVTYHATEAFDPATGAWASLPRMPHPRHGLGAAVLGTSIHVVAGGPTPGLTYSGHNERLRLG